MLEINLERIKWLSTLSSFTILLILIWRVEIFFKKRRQQKKGALVLK